MRSAKSFNEVHPSGKVIDTDGGTSVLAGPLLDAGYSLTVLNISEAALARARQSSGAGTGDITHISR
jgi:hypothetical protein